MMLIQSHYVVSYIIIIDMQYLKKVKNTYQNTQMS